MKSATMFLQGVILLAGIGALAFMLWEPQIEGRNAHATLAQIYFDDPFLAFAYIASIPFFAALYQAFTVLGYARHDKVFAPAAVKALRTMKFCGMAMLGFVVTGEVLLMLGVFGESDDRAGGVFMGGLIAFGAIVIVAAAAMFERILQDGVDMKSRMV